MRDMFYHGLRINSFAIKAEVRDTEGAFFVFAAQKTMYGGKGIMVDDLIYMFASENEGGSGLFARGIVTGCDIVARTAAARQTPRVSIRVERCETARSPLGRTELRAFRDRTSNVPEAELDFKLYRQATNKIVGLTDRAGEFLSGLF